VLGTNLLLGGALVVVVAKHSNLVVRSALGSGDHMVELGERA
jgi:hypothetical protein